MGQLFCKDCCSNNDGSVTKKRGAFITWGDAQDDDIFYTDNNSLNKKGISSSEYNNNNNNESNNDNLIRSKRAVRHKKRNVALHAEFRDRFQNNMISSPTSSSVGGGGQLDTTTTGNINSNNNDILAPPLCPTKVMVATDNVFCGVELGVDTLLTTQSTSSSSVASIGSSSGGSFDNSSGASEAVPQDMATKKIKQQKRVIARIGKSVGVEGLTGGRTKQQQQQQNEPQIFPKTPEEEAFITSALSDTDTNFILDGIPTHLRQTLLLQMERITVPKHHLLIRRGDTSQPQYLYLLHTGSIGVYIDPSECNDDENVIDIKIKRSNSSSGALSSMGGGSGASSPKKQQRNDFKQSYVLNLRKSLFQSSHDDGGGNNNILGQVISLVKDSFTMGANDDAERDANNEDEAASTTTATAIARGEISTPIIGVSGGIGSSSSATTVGTAASALPALLEEKSVDTETDMSFTPLTDLQKLRHERDLGPMDVFGELALIYNCPRTASCLTNTPCTLYRVDGEFFKGILSSSNADREKLRCTESQAAIEALHNLGVVENWLDEKSLNDLRHVLNPITFHKVSCI